MLGPLLAGSCPDTPIDWPALWTEATRHRVHLVLANRVAQSASFVDCPPATRDAMREALREAALVELARARELRRVLTELAARDVPVVVFKGEALAYTCYLAPHLRPRIDVDLFVRVSDVDRVHAAMVDAGYRHDPTVGGRHVIPQHHYEKPSAYGLDLVDVHWRLANLAAFADTITFEELAADAVPVPTLGRAARVPCDVHALLIACLHRVAHHQDAGDLVWLYDIHLLAGRLDEHAWTRFAQLATARDMRAVCRHSLGKAAQHFLTPVPAWLDRSLAEAPAEPSAVFLAPTRPRRTLDVELANLRSVRRWRDRVTVVREHLFPPAKYMLARYGQRRVWLPALYVRRVLTGGARWLRARH